MYPRCRPLISRLEQSGSIESLLEEYQSQAESDPERKRQIVAIQFYLRDLIQKCEHAWTTYTNGVSNYGTLFDHVRRNLPAYVVTFNYDTILEKGLEDFGYYTQSMERAMSDAAKSTLSVWQSTGFETH